MSEAQNEIASTVKIVVIVILAYLMISSWDQVIYMWVFKTLKLDTTEISSWLVLSIITTIVLIVLLYVSGIRISTLFKSVKPYGSKLSVH